MNRLPHRFVSGGWAAECPAIPAALGGTVAILGATFLDIEVNHDGGVAKRAVSLTRLYRHREHTTALGAWKTQIVGVGRHVRERMLHRPIVKSMRKLPLK